MLIVLFKLRVPHYNVKSNLVFNWLLARGILRHTYHKTKILLWGYHSLNTCSAHACFNHIIYTFQIGTKFASAFSDASCERVPPAGITRTMSPWDATERHLGSAPSLSSEAWCIDFVEGMSSEMVESSLNFLLSCALNIAVTLPRERELRNERNLWRDKFRTVLPLLAHFKCLVRMYTRQFNNPCNGTELPA